MTRHRPLRRHVVLSLAAIVLFSGVAVVASGQDNSDPLGRDQDFHVQGEYVGAAKLDGRSWDAVALQVVARGSGSFHAVMHVGGLPGAGWNGSERLKLTGKRRAEQITLHGEQLRVTLTQVAPRAEPQWAQVLDGAGRQIGRLTKIHRRSPTMGALPTDGATVLFDGSPPDQLDGASLSADGLLNAGTTTKMPVGDFYLHVEFRSPYEPNDEGQARGNSGVYIQRRYEVQILDSFGLDGAANECGGLYRQRPPAVNMCLPPLTWQTYDIYFTAARWDAAGNKTANARITVLQNGVPIHNDVEIPAKTGAGQPEANTPLPIHFQNHNDAVVFRNIWLAPRNVLDEVIHFPHGHGARCRVFNGLRHNGD